ncbi:DUF2270 domain-containing protein [Natronoarchaeum rubrum]|uniref:DUF2270 domain-containing protein n=1 Tax=Natronoarchaeum rubrum TaxID=755311 RepID=UPI002111452D|nr:DUF2270 domain-containing protein [Natronoarchaeum rubrum]HMB49576.1 DUF2270 domain-containing protein [Natronoarchaeum rubrum]
MGGDDDRSDRFDPEGEPEREVAQQAATDDQRFLDLLPHYYRGEVSHLTTELRRIDQTSDWAVAVMAGIITLTFSGRNIPSYLLFVGMAAMCVFLVFESRRYRTYDAWRSRVRLLQENVFANAFDPSGVEHEDWRRELGSDLRRPTLKITFREALSRRMHRVYGPLLLVLGAAWIVKITLFAPDRSAIEAAELPALDGIYVIGAVGLFYAAVLAIAYWPAEREAKGEFHGEEVGEWKREK